jgi:hypothetical protein
MYMRVLKSAVSFALLVGVVLLVGFYYDVSEFSDDIRALSIGALGAILFALLANAFAAVLRFKVIASEIEHPITFRRAMAAVSAGSLAGALFFQIAGQLMARGLIAGRGGVPFAAVVIITAYERFTAAIVSALFALSGAFFIFGNVYLDQSSGGAELLKILAGLIAATTAGALMGYGRVAARTITPLLTRHFTQRCLTIIGLTLLVHIPMQTAYIVAAHTLSPQTSIANLVAVSAIVMFATGVPVSLAGWGMREMSAVVGLGAIGVPAHAALTAAVTIGFSSLLVAGMFAAVSLPGHQARKQPVQTQAAKSVDYYRVLSWVLPIGAATLVLFQIYIPVRSGLLNVNLADPLAMLGGALFILGAFRAGKMPDWRVAHINLAVIVTTLVLGGSLLIGVDRFGWTTWAVTNRFLGWFVLLAYGATGALIVRNGHKEGFRTMLLTYAGATAAVASVEIFLATSAGLGFQVPVVSTAVEGFSLNHNFFAFQLLMAVSVGITVVRGASVRIIVLTLLLAGLWLAVSRSGWIAAISVLATGLYLRVVNVREISIAIAISISIAAACGAAAVLAAIIGPRVEHGLSLVEHGLSSIAPIVPSGTSTNERLISIVGGLKLFIEHPVFGAGLGAFRNQMILASSGLPLLIHSTGVWLLAELGTVGFAVFTVSAAYVFFNEWPHARKEQASALVVLCFVAFAVMSGPADMLYQRTFWLMIGAGLAVLRFRDGTATGPGGDR